MELDRRQRVMGFAIEGLVIVASILLAFAIDATWDRYQERERVQEYLVALEGEFVSAQEEMLDHIAEQSSQLQALDEALEGLVAGEPEEYLLPRLSWLNALYIYGPAHPVFEDLANAGAIDMLESTELRYALLRYGQSRDFLTALAQRESELWHNQMQAFLIERTDVLPQLNENYRGDLAPRFPSGLEALYEDRTFQNLLLSRKVSIVGQLRVGRQALEAIETVLAQVRMLIGDDSVASTG